MCFVSDEWLRPLLKQDNQVLVHWWYYPDRFVRNNNKKKNRILLEFASAVAYNVHVLKNTSACANLFCPFKVLKRYSVVGLNRFLVKWFQPSLKLDN